MAETSPIPFYMEDGKRIVRDLRYLLPFGGYWEGEESQPDENGVTLVRCQVLNGTEEDEFYYKRRAM